MLPESAGDGAGAGGILGKGKTETSKKGRQQKTR